jgi:hypothetical protein
MLTVNSANNDVEITRGDDQTITFTVTKADGSVQDVTGWAFAFTVKEDIDDDIADAKFQKTSGGGGIVLTTPASGIIDVTVAHGDTNALAGKYTYDLQGIDGSGNIRTVASARFVVRKDVTTPGTAGNPSAPNPAFPGGASFVGPVVTGVAPTYNEIIVDPNGQIGGYTTIQAAINYALPLSSASDPWTIRLLPGIYEQTAVLNAAGAQYLTFIGAGADATIINRATALDDSDTTYASITRDPVLKLTGSVGCQVMNLTIRHQGTPVSSPSRRPTALSINDATGFRAFNAKFLSSYTGVSANSNTLPATYTEAVENIFHNCDIKVVQLGGSGLSAADTFWVINQYAALLNCFTTMESEWIGPDTIRFDSGTLRVVGGYHSRIYTGSQTQPNNTTSGSAVNVAQTATTPHLLAEGAHFHLDIASTVTVSGSLVDIGTIIVGTPAFDFDLNFSGCLITYSTGTVTNRTIAGIITSAPTSGDAINGTIRLNGTQIRDVGGSGGTNRKDIMVTAGFLTGTNRIIKAIYQTGSRIASVGHRVTAGAPTMTGTYGSTEPTVNRQTGTATFATAATVAVTLPVPFATLGAVNVTDYSVQIEAAVNETFWITAKTSTGFTINSSNGASTATVRYTVTR